MTTEYTQTTTYDDSMQDLIRMWSNTTTKRFIENFNSLIDAELTSIASSTMDAYTFTQATWDKDVSEVLFDLNNDTNRRCFKNFLDLMAVEFVDIAANGYSYTLNATQLTARRCFETCSNSIHVDLVHKMLALIQIELNLVVDGVA